MLSVNVAIVALCGHLQADKTAVGAAQKTVWLWAIPAPGAIVCMAWVVLLISYRKLNRAKFTVLTEIEHDLPGRAVHARARGLTQRPASVAVQHRAPDPGLSSPSSRRHACRGSRDQGARDSHLRKSRISASRNPAEHPGPPVYRTCRRRIRICSVEIGASWSGLAPARLRPRP
jgi:hypothetical protein